MGFVMSTDRNRGVEVTFLGDFSLSVDGHVISDQTWKRKTARTIIKLLILNRPNVVTIDQLIEACESHTPSANNRQSIYSRISDIRHILEPDLKRANQSNFIAKKGEGYAFVYDGPIDIDLMNFDDRLMHAIEAFEASDWTDAQALHKDAIALYQGDFLCEDLYEDWTTPYREKYRSKLIQALERAACISQKQSHHQEGIEYLNHAIELEPHHERLYLHKMELHALLGEKEQALECYSECERVLDDYLGIEPSPESRELFQSIVDDKIGATPQAIEHNLPKQINSFVARERELQELANKINNPDCHLVTILGSGGIGKSRLALEFAKSLLENQQFSDGIFYVPIEQIESESELVKLIASSVGIEFFGPASTREQLFNQLKYREALLILDSFEMAISQTDLVDELVRSSSKLKVIVTSRERLKLSEEWILHLEGLAYQPEAESTDRSEKTAAEQLFFERSAQMEHQSVDSDDLDAIPEICALCEGMPLAIELAAALTRAMTCKRIHVGIRENLALLKSDFIDKDERHRSIHAVFEQSYQSCAEEERLAFIKLSIFKGGFTEEAAAHVASANLDTLGALTGKSMIMIHPNGRYHIHDLLRQYGREKLESTTSDGLAETARQHAQYIDELLEKLGPELESEHQIEALHQTEPELKNIDQAWAWALQHNDEALLRKSAEVFFRHFEHRMLYADGKAFFSKAYQALKESAGISRSKSIDHKLLLLILRMLALYEMRVGELEASREHLAEASKLLEKHPNRSEQVHLQATLAQVEAYLGNQDAAFSLVNEFLPNLRHLERASDIPRYTNVVAFVHFRFGDYRETIKVLQRSLESQNESTPLSRLSALGLLGNAYHYLGNNNEALKYMDLCLSSAAMSKPYAALMSHNAGIILAGEGQFEEAEEKLILSYKSSTQIGHQVQRIYSLEKLVEICIEDQDLSQALEYVKIMTDITNQTQNTHIKAQTLFTSGSLAMAQDKGSQAEELLHEAIAIQSESGDRFNESRSMQALAQVFLLSDDFESAFETLQKALGLACEIQNSALILNIVIDLIMILFQKNEYELCARMAAACMTKDSLEQRQIGKLETLLKVIESELDQENYDRSTDGASELALDQIVKEVQSVSTRSLRR